MILVEDRIGGKALQFSFPANRRKNQAIAKQFRSGKGGQSSGTLNVWQVFMKQTD
jgi:hypothetical protein